jgi:hypothetical protein
MSYLVHLTNSNDDVSVLILSSEFFYLPEELKFGDE